MGRRCGSPRTSTTSPAPASSTGSASKSKVLEEAATFSLLPHTRCSSFWPTCPLDYVLVGPITFLGFPWGVSLWFPTGAAVLARDRLSLQRHGVCRTLLPAAARHIYDFDELFNYRASFLK